MNNNFDGEAYFFHEKLKKASKIVNALHFTDESKIKLLIEKGFARVEAEALIYGVHVYEHEKTKTKTKYIKEQKQLKQRQEHAKKYLSKVTIIG